LKNAFFGGASRSLYASYRDKQGAQVGKVGKRRQPGQTTLGFEQEAKIQHSQEGLEAGRGRGVTFRPAPARPQNHKFPPTLPPSPLVNQLHPPRPPPGAFQHLLGHRLVAFFLSFTSLRSIVSQSCKMADSDVSSPCSPCLDVSCALGQKFPPRIAPAPRDLTMRTRRPPSPKLRTVVTHRPQLLFPISTAIYAGDRFL